MFDSAEIGHKLSKQEYKEIEPALRADLLDAQYALSQDGRFSVLVLIAGVRGAGKGETVNLLNEWMDPRHITNVAFDRPTDEESRRPTMWRFWRALPPRGKVGVMFGSWYTDPIIERVFKRSKRCDFNASTITINRLERMLANDGVVLLKYWFHLSKERQKKRLEKLSKDPETSWRISDRDWMFFRHYDRFFNISEEMICETSQAWAPWIVVEGSDPRYRAVTVGRVLLDAIRQRVSSDAEPKTNAVAPPIVAPVDKLQILDTLDLSRRLSKKRYQGQLKKYQRAIGLLTRHKRFAEHSVVVVFEGMDAAGKGGAIRRISAAVDARLYQIVPIAAPTDEERLKPYLWRFWRHVPLSGRITIYDRSWYGRVLVERVEDFASEFDWMRAYSEINDFEQQLFDGGSIVVKYWLQISKEEQYQRFKQREETRHKQFKITDEDWRNRERWDDYRAAASDMIDRTNTSLAPWTLIEANDKYWARIKVLRTLVAAMEERFG